MSESNDGTDETPVTGTEGGASDMMRAVMSEQQPEDGRERIRRLMNAANNRNAGRPEEPPQQQIVLRKSPDSPEYVIATAPTARHVDDPSDPTKPVLGTTDLIEEIVVTTQRFGAFAHWPSDKKAEALGLVERVVKQRAIAQQVVAIARRDSAQARAYRERRKLAREAARLVHDYLLDPSGKRTRISSGEISTDSNHYAEAIDHLGTFVAKIAALPAIPEDEEGSDAVG